MEAMGKLIKMKVCIVGMRGLGVETAKNLILAGPASVTLYDPTIVQIQDLSANFYLCEADVDEETRADACLAKLKALNPYVDVSVLEEFSGVDDLMGYDVVVVTEMIPSLGPVEELNQKLRSAGTGFILSETLGAAGYVFLDYGERHRVFDPDGEPTR